MITTEQIKELRERTGISIGQCKKALEDANGDLDKALEALRAKGAEIASKKSARNLGAGVVSAYIHNTHTVGAMIELFSETDFVAKNPDFRILADDIAMHVAALMPADATELLSQPFVKDPSLTVNDVIQASIQKFGERIEVGQMVRFSTSSR